MDKIIVKPNVEILEMINGFETANKYNIFNSAGQQMFSAKEQTEFCSRQFCGPMRGFAIKIEDTIYNEIIHLERPPAYGCGTTIGPSLLFSCLTCCTVPLCCCMGALQSMEVTLYKISTKCNRKI